MRPPKPDGWRPLEAHLGLAQDQVELVGVRLEGQLRLNQVAQQAFVDGDRDVLHREHGLAPLQAADRFAQTLDLALEDHLPCAQLAPALVPPAATSGRGQGRRHDHSRPNGSHGPGSFSLSPDGWGGRVASSSVDSHRSASPAMRSTSPFTTTDAPAVAAAITAGRGALGPHPQPRAHQGAVELEEGVGEHAGADPDALARAGVEVEHELLRVEVDLAIRGDRDLLGLHEHGLDLHLAVHDVDPGHGAVEPGVRVLGRERVQLRGELADDAAPEHSHEAALDLARSDRHQDRPVRTRRHLPRRGAPRLELHLHARRGHLAGIDTLPGGDAGAQALRRGLDGQVGGAVAGRQQLHGATEGAFVAALGAPLEHQLAAVDGQRCRRRPSEGLARAPPRWRRRAA